MKIIKRIFLLIVWTIFIMKNFVMTEIKSSLSGNKIIETMDQKLTFDEGEMWITIEDMKNNVVTKTLKSRILYKKGKGTVMEFTFPAREKSKKILLVKDNMWLFVPGISKPVRLSAKDSFMGTSFSNRDMMDFELNNDYNAKILIETEKEYKIELSAINKNVPYPKVIVNIDKTTYLPIKQDLYTVSDNLIKTIIFSDIKDLNGKVRPTTIRVKDILMQGNETKVTLDKMLEKSVDVTNFLPQNITR
ncbi:MAG: outer membrane lipoprotein-sorting protein [Endomicrobiia bacterium]